ncbi:MAG: family 20 glycosylhydrolase [Anaerolineae bacterium]
MTGNLQAAGEWRGVHVLTPNAQAAEAAIAQAPALAALGVNLLIVELDYFYAYTSHPELSEPNPVTHEQARRLVRSCQEHGIRLIPQFNCLGHQSWAEQTYALLRQYPEFDETPGQYPNNAGIYCRSWCPRQEALLPIVFDLFDELIDTFEADALHVGMDEVFVIASEHCPRCKGMDPVRLYAQAVGDYYNYLLKRGVEMLIWGDRFLDDQIMGYGEWEADRLHIHPAVDRVAKDIIICDWHYELRSSYPSIPFFLEKGFRVLPSGWRDERAVEALVDYAQAQGSERMLGYLATTWNGVKPEDVAAWSPITIAMRKLVDVTSARM